MTRIVVDAAVSSQLNQPGQVVEVVDPSGRVLGHFMVCPSIPGFDPSEWEYVEPDISEEELQRREQSNDWVTSEEAFARLRSQEKE